MSRHDHSVASRSALFVMLLIAFLVTVPSKAHAQDRNWWSGFYQGASGNVWTMQVYDGRLIVGGDFEQIGGKDIPYLAAWDGKEWSSLGEGPGGEIRSLTVYDGDLIAAGYLANRADYIKKYVMRWNGNEWSRVGGPFNASIWSLAVYGEDLIAGGYFSTAEEDTCRGIARWDGTRWRPLGEGLVDGWDRPTIWALAAHQGYLYAGGSIKRSGTAAMSGIARWNGAAWSAVGTGFDYDVGGLAIYRGDLIAGGNFVKAGEVTVNSIARWNGESWESMGGGLRRYGTQYDWCSAGALTVMGHYLFAGGSFQIAGTGGAAKIAAWNGVSWMPVGTGLGEGAVRHASALTLCSYDGSVYAGGLFGEAGGEKSEFIARWSQEPYPPSLAYFFAARDDDSVILDWRPAGSLSEHATFRIHRESVGRERVEIAGLISVHEGNLTFTDPAPIPEATDYWIETVTPEGVVTWFGPVSVAATQTPALRLAQNRPNPFHQSTSFHFEVSQRSVVALTIVDVTGREVAVPFPATVLEPGEQAVEWNGNGTDGQPVPCGVYFYVLRSGEGQQSRKLIVQR